MKLHRSQMTSAERARARQEAKVNAGMELNEGSFHHWGSDLDDVLK